MFWYWWQLVKLYDYIAWESHDHDITTAEQYWNPYGKVYEIKPTCTLLDEQAGYTDVQDRMVVAMRLDLKSFCAEAVMVED